MYQIGRPVYVKSHDSVGVITEANYIGKPRHACYVVTLPDGNDFMCGKDNLRAADWCCDGCNRWLPNSSRFADTKGDIYGDDALAFCFLCASSQVNNRNESYPYV